MTIWAWVAVVLVAGAVVPSLVGWLLSLVAIGAVGLVVLNCFGLTG